MSEILAAQLIYTNVEKEHSPQRREGWQTLFYTKSALTEPEVEEVEARLLYCRSSGKDVKRVFFVTRTGKVVAAQVVALPEEDFMGRTGRSFAHAIVLTDADFAQLGKDPFVVFDQVTFLKLVDDALARGDCGSGNIAGLPLRSRPPLKREPELALWDREALRTLLLLALQAERLALERARIVFVGTSDQIEEAIRAAMVAVPGDLRSRCTFDTYFHGCNPAATYFWAVGYPEEVSGASICVVDAGTCQVSGTRPEPQTAYERWVLRALASGKLTDIASYREQVHGLCRWLTGHSPDLREVDTLPDSILEVVLGVNHEDVRRKLDSKLREQIPRVLLRRILWRVEHEHQGKPKSLLNCIRVGFDIRWLCDLLYQTYIEASLRVSSPDELNAIGELLEKQSANGLRLVHAWATRNRHGFAEELQQLDEDCYRKVVRALLRQTWNDLTILVLTTRAGLFLEEYLPTVRPGTLDMPTLTDVLITTGNACNLERLVPFIQAQPIGSLKQVARMIAGNPEVPSAFAQTVTAAIEQATPGRLRASVDNLLKRCARLRPW